MSTVPLVCLLSWVVAMLTPALANSLPEQQLPVGPADRLTELASPLLQSLQLDSETAVAATQRLQKLLQHVSAARRSRHSSGGQPAAPAARLLGSVRYTGLERLALALRDLQLSMEARLGLTNRLLQQVLDEQELQVEDVADIKDDLPASAPAPAPAPAPAAPGCAPPSLARQCL